jgi:hypothetical protein
MTPAIAPANITLLIMNLFLKIVGVILLCAGFVLAIKPDLFGKLATPFGSYQMIEKRVKWGMLIGLGGFMFVHSNWTSWGLLVLALLIFITLGIILARLIGFVLDGIFVKQIYWLMIEVIALITFEFLYWKQKH